MKIRMQESSTESGLDTTRWELAFMALLWMTVDKLP